MVASEEDSEDVTSRWKWAEMLALPRTSSSSDLWYVPAPTTTKAPISMVSGSRPAATRDSRADLMAHPTLSGSAPTVTVNLSPSLAPRSMTWGPDPNTSTGTFDSPSYGSQVIRL